MTDHASWVAVWQRTAAAVRAHDGEIRSFVVSSPAAESEVAAVEERLGWHLPRELRDTLLQFSSSVQFRWTLPRMPAVAAPLHRLSHGGISWDLSALVGHEAGRAEWAEIYDAPSEAAIWADKLAFQRAANGDLLAIDLVASGNPVVYLDHDGESALHGRVLAPGFDEFVSRWSAIGCIGPESWELAPLVGEQGLDPAGQAARAWATWFRGPASDPS